MPSPHPRRLPWVVATAATAVALWTSALWWTQAGELTRLRAELASRPQAPVPATPAAAGSPHAPAAPRRAPVVEPPPPPASADRVPPRSLEVAQPPAAEALKAQEIDELRAEKVPPVVERTEAVVDDFLAKGRLSEEDATAARALLVQEIRETWDLKHAVMMGDLTNDQGREDYRILAAEIEEELLSHMDPEVLQQLREAIASQPVRP